MWIARSGIRLALSTRTTGGWIRPCRARTPYLTIAFVYDLPVGKRKAFGNRLPILVNAVVGNWRISAIQRYQSGAPLGIASSQNLFGGVTHGPVWRPARVIQFH